MAYCHGHTKGDMRVFPIEVILTDDTKIRKASSPGAELTIWS